MAKENKPTELADYKYVGDDGGRWLFERRLDGLCFTIDKPQPALLTPKTAGLSVRLTVRGKKFRPEILAMVRQ